MPAMQSRCLLLAAVQFGCKAVVGTFAVGRAVHDARMQHAVQHAYVMALIGEFGNDPFCAISSSTLGQHCFTLESTVEHALHTDQAMLAQSRRSPSRQQQLLVMIPIMVHVCRQKQDYRNYTRCATKFDESHKFGAGQESHAWHATWVVVRAAFIAVVGLIRSIRWDTSRRSYCSDLSSLT
eukprot:GHUV01058293.1.p2 GENE.GHUV01058293.1~~GHUV01058293.1.p2  ORF type:complete len:181 (-),score=31.36 GHUV01058293.1:57-599(-)